MSNKSEKLSIEFIGQFQPGELEKEDDTVNIDEVLDYIRKNEKQLMSIELWEDESVESVWANGSPHTVETRTRITLEYKKVEHKIPPTHKEELKQ